MVPIGSLLADHQILILIDQGGRVYVLDRSGQPRQLQMRPSPATPHYIMMSPDRTELAFFTNARLEGRQVAGYDVAVFSLETGNVRTVLSNVSPILT